MPLLSSLQASVAGRYDRYGYGDKNPGKFTYSTGLEWRPVDTLLVRGSYGTGFRAPDMHYLFAGQDYYRTRFATDYYQCRIDEPGYGDGDCYDDGSWDVSTFDVYTGNLALDVETSRSMTAGFVWSPTASFDIAMDFYKSRPCALALREHPPQGLLVVDAITPSQSQGSFTPQARKI